LSADQAIATAIPALRDADQQVIAKAKAQAQAAFAHANPAS
jgi:hypothetical protein